MKYDISSGGGEIEKHKNFNENHEIKKITNEVSSNDNNHNMPDRLGIPDISKSLKCGVNLIILAAAATATYFRISHFRISLKDI